MQTNYNRKIFLLLFLLTGVTSLWAEQVEADTALVLQEVVVTGSRSERPVTQSPGSISVVTPLLLRNSPA